MPDVDVLCLVHPDLGGMDDFLEQPEEQALETVREIVVEPERHALALVRRWRSA